MAPIGSVGPVMGEKPRILFVVSLVSHTKHLVPLLIHWYHTLGVNLYLNASAKYLYVPFFIV